MFRSLLIFLAFLTALVANAAGTSRTLIKEDFSRMPSGTPEVPWSFEIVTEEGDYIPAKYTSTPGWRGRGVHQAGGSCALMSFADPYGRESWGYISTPPTYLGGNLVLTLRAKRTPGSRASLWVSLYAEGTIEPLVTEQFELTTRWSTFTFTVPDTPADVLSYVAVEAEFGTLVVDDIKATFYRTEIFAPKDLRIVNLSESAFAAEWTDMNVDSYLCNLFTLGYTGDASETVYSEGFDNGIPEDWEIRGASLTDDPDVCGVAVPALEFADEGDLAVSPEFDAPLQSIEFTLMSDDDMVAEPDFSALLVEVYRAESEVWEPIDLLAGFDGGSRKRTVFLQRDRIGAGATRVRFSMPVRCYNDFAIDDLVITCGPDPQPDYVFKDLEVTEPSIDFSGLDADEDYYLNVRSCEGRLVSAECPSVWFDGLIGLPVQNVEVEVPSPGNVELTWNPVPHADYYRVSMASSLTAYGQPIAGCTVLEDEFENGADGSMWSATNPVDSERGISTGGSTSAQKPGMIYSPSISLGANAGRGFYVDFTVITTTDSYFDSLTGMTPEGIRVSVHSDSSGLIPLASSVVSFPQQGENSGRVWVDTSGVDDLDSVFIALQTVSGMQFTLTRIWVCQDLLPGETLVVPLCPPMVTDLPSFNLTGLDTGVDHIFTVTAEALRGVTFYTGQPSAPVTAFTNMSVQEIESEKPESQELWYDLNGRPATSASSLIISNQGKKRLRERE